MVLRVGGNCFYSDCHGSDGNVQRCLGVAVPVIACGTIAKTTTTRKTPGNYVMGPEVLSRFVHVNISHGQCD